jgi:hypothetical protein
MRLFTRLIRRLRLVRFYDFCGRLLNVCNSVAAITTVLFLVVVARGHAATSISHIPISYQNLADTTTAATTALLTQPLTARALLLAAEPLLVVE